MPKVKDFNAKTLTPTPGPWEIKADGYYIVAGDPEGKSPKIIASAPPVDPWSLADLYVLAGSIDCYEALKSLWRDFGGEPTPAWKEKAIKAIARAEGSGHSFGTRNTVDDVMKNRHPDKAGLYDVALPQAFAEDFKEITGLWPVGLMVWLYDEKAKVFGRPYPITERASEALRQYNEIKGHDYPLT